MTGAPSSAGLDDQVRLHIYRHFAEHGSPPRRADTASRLGLDDNEASAAYRRLADGHVIVLQPGTDEILMANPWSAVPTDFRVTVSGREWYGNCIWDGLGVVAMLGGAGTVCTSCPDCGQAMEVEIADYKVVRGDGIGHFAVPAGRWWEDIGYT